MIKNSIAMATYNGEKFLKEQIDSVLLNMGSDDELVISDDGSKDHTIDIIKEYQQKDSRIKLFNGPGKGVKQNFANAIEHTSGKYIYLCDQDDVWRSDKIEKVSEIFSKEHCMVVCHNSQIVNYDLKSMGKTFFQFRGSRSGRLKNIVKNTYIGCCMAFDASLKEKILPIPDNIAMHDQWIGIIAEKYGKSVFYDECLIKYRRHSNNVSDMKHLPIPLMIKNRIVFVCEYLKRLGGGK